MKVGTVDALLEDHLSVTPHLTRWSPAMTSDPDLLGPS